MKFSLPNYKVVQMLDQTLLNTNRKNRYDGVFSLIIINLLVFVADHVLSVDLIKNFYLDLSPQSFAPKGLRRRASCGRST